MNNNELYLGEALLKDNPSKNLRLKINDGAITTNKIKDGSITPDKLSDELKAKISFVDTLFHKFKGIVKFIGKVNVTATGNDSGLLLDTLNEGNVQVYSISNGASASEGTVTFSTAMLKQFANWQSTAALGANIGDLLIVYKSTLVYGFILPMSGAKSASDNFPGADGLETKEDKGLIEKIPSIETMLDGMASSEFQSHSEQDVDSAFETGIYPWCTSGVPSSGEVALIVFRTKNTDNFGYYSIYQIAFGREEKNKYDILCRLIRKNDSEDKIIWTDWVEISSRNVINSLRDEVQRAKAAESKIALDLANEVSRSSKKGTATDNSITEINNILSKRLNYIEV